MPGLTLWEASTAFLHNKKGSKQVWFPCCRDIYKRTGIIIFCDWNICNSAKRLVNYQLKCRDNAAELSPHILCLCRVHFILPQDITVTCLSQIIRRRRKSHFKLCSSSSWTVSHPIVDSQLVCWENKAASRHCAAGSAPRLQERMDDHTLTVFSLDLSDVCGPSLVVTDLICRNNNLILKMWHLNVMHESNNDNKRKDRQIL